ncbi:588_t:CDS:2, partial [Dentiscutata heterogama]
MQERKGKALLRTPKNKKKQIIDLIEKKNLVDILKIANHQEHITTWASRETELYKRKVPFARLRKKDQARVCIDLKKITEEDWNNYKEKLEKELKKLFGNKEKSREQQQLPSITNLQKNTPELQDHQIENEELKDLRKDIRVMGKWCRKLKKLSHFENTTNSYEEQ